MKAAICEDNHFEAELLYTMINKCSQAAGIPFDSIRSFSSAEELLDADEAFELYFIDCQLPGASGMALAKNIRERFPSAELIFVTEFLEYSPEGYEYNALRYLLKPVDEKKLTDALDAFRQKQKHTVMLDLKCPGMTAVIKSSEIMYIEAMGNYTVVRLGSTEYRSTITLEKFEELLPEQTFFRTSRQYIVNVAYVAQVTDVIVMINGERVKTSRARIAGFKKHYKEYLLQSDSQDA